MYQIIKKTHSFNYLKILYSKHPQLFPYTHTTYQKNDNINNGNNHNDIYINEMKLMNRISTELKRLNRIKIFINNHLGSINSNLSYTFIIKILKY